MEGGHLQAEDRSSQLGFLPPNPPNKGKAIQVGFPMWTPPAHQIHATNCTHTSWQRLGGSV